MKFNQSDLLKLGLSAGAGYLGAKLLIPHHRGFATKGCGNPNNCSPGDGKTYSCCHIPRQFTDVCQGACGHGQGPNDPWNNMNWISGAESGPHGVQQYPHGVGSQGADDLRQGVVSAANPPGGGGPGGIGNIFNGLPGTIFGIATPIVIIGGLAALILLTRK